MGRVVAILLIVGLVVHFPAQGQNLQQHTVELNLYAMLATTLDFHYSYHHSQSKVGLRVESGYSYEREVMFYSNLSARNLERIIIEGYFIKAGPEIGIYEEELKRVSIALMPYFGMGKVGNYIKIDYPLGPYRNRELYEYKVYGAALHFGVTLWQSNNWFYAVAMEQSLVIQDYGDNPVPQREYPGVGTLYSDLSAPFSFAIRFTGTLGYRF